MFENRSIFDEVKTYEVKAYKVCQYLGHPVCRPTVYLKTSIFMRFPRSAWNVVYTV